MMSVRLRLFVGVCVVLGLGVWTGSALADPVIGPQICPGTETAISGTYGRLVLNGDYYVPSGETLTVQTDLVIEPDACLDAFTMGTVTVFHNIDVYSDGILALGCTINAIGPDDTPCTGTTNDVVGWNVIAYDAMTMYLDGDTILGNVTSVGGGPGVTFDPYVNFAIKDNVIHGKVTVMNWNGAWFGLIRNIIGGTVAVSNNGGLPDSNEVVSNTIGGNLTCYNNSPAIEYGDSGGSPNIVHGQKLGQCTAV
jgi:hypothetical protein